MKKTRNKSKFMVFFLSLLMVFTSSIAVYGSGIYPEQQNALTNRIPIYVLCNEAIFDAETAAELLLEIYSDSDSYHAYSRGRSLGQTELEDVGISQLDDFSIFPDFLIEQIFNRIEEYLAEGFNLYYVLIPIPQPDELYGGIVSLSTPPGSFLTTTDGFQFRFWDTVFGWSGFVRDSNSGTLNWAQFSRATAMLGVDIISSFFSPIGTVTTMVGNISNFQNSFNIPVANIRVHQSGTSVEYRLVGSTTERTITIQDLYNRHGGSFLPIARVERFDGRLHTFITYPRMVGNNVTLGSNTFVSPYFHVLTPGWGVANLGHSTLNHRREMIEAYRRLNPVFPNLPVNMLFDVLNLRSLANVALRI